MVFRFEVFYKPSVPLNEFASFRCENSFKIKKNIK